jgi:hypothetical protein
MPPEKTGAALHREVGEMRSSKKVWARILLVVMSSFLAVMPSRAAGGSNGRGDPHVFRVIDKLGTLVGYTVTENMVARQIGADWVTFYVHTGLGIFDSNAIYVYYMTTDCSGTRYIPHYSTFAEGTRVGPQLYYPADQQVLNPQSVRVVYGNGDPDGLCQATSNLSGVFGTVATVNVDSFGLQLPFKAVQ